MRTVHIGIERGAEIVDSNGTSVGKVHEIIYNERQEVDFLIIQQGLLFKHDVAIPHDAIGKVEDGKVCLAVPKDNLSTMLRPDAAEPDVGEEAAIQRTTI